MIRFSLTLKALTPIVLPQYKGSTLRGGFGHAFKKVVCTVKIKECSDCLLKPKCIYSYVFETPPPEDSLILRKYEKAPHPYVIEPPTETNTNYQPGDTMTFGLVLIGKAVEYLPYFIYTFEELGKIGIGKRKGKYELTDVSQDGEQIYNSVDRRLKPVTRKFPAIPVYLKKWNDKISSSDDGELKRVLPNRNIITINFITPVRIVENEDLVVDLEFHHLIRSLLRRISTLSYFHCNERLDLDFKGFIERAQSVKVEERKTEWYDWERYSARQDTRMKMGGVIGKISFEGAIAEFMPLLELGKILHVGKNTSFGLGRYSIEQFHPLLLNANEMS